MKPKPTSMQSSEAKTRQALIDPLLKQAGWDVSDHKQVQIELPVDGYDAAPWNGVTDYCLRAEDGSVIAVVEAKRCSRSSRDGQAQLQKYVHDIGRHQEYHPFGFMTNGRDIWFWEVDQEVPRMVAGFFGPEDLARLLFIRTKRRPLENHPINTAIVDRPYQHEAIRRVAEAFAQKKRKALLVMATGTGKTRVTMGLVDLFLKTYQALHVLFLADRDALVDQALTDGFKRHLPDEPRDRIYTYKIDTSKRLFVATEQTMSLCFQQFNPGFFDLIIFDEAHRSIFNRFTEVMQYFDARQIGLTATPANFIERDTFMTFGCTDQKPTFLYTFQDAVRERYLADFNVYQAQTGYQRDGIKGRQLTEEARAALLQEGIDPDALDFEGTQLEKEVSNKDTIRRQWGEIWDQCLKDQSGQLPGKTIVFAMTKKHAERLRDVFEEMYPQHPGLIQVIMSGVERVRDGTYGAGLITKFKHNDLPRIAISVDMLETGIDVPEVVNLVFMKPVESRIKLWQMIGRGTRSHETCKYYDRLPGGHKTEFKIIDFWQNDFNKAPTTVPPIDLPILVSIFNTRLKILETAGRSGNAEVRTQTVADLRAMLGRLPKESFPIRRVLPEIESVWTDDFWTAPRPIAGDLVQLRNKVAPLLRFVGDVDVAAEAFTSKVERLKLQRLTGQASPAQLASIAQDVARLPEFVRQDPQLKDAVGLCLSDKLAQASPSDLSAVIRTLAPQMRFRREQPDNLILIDIPDFLAASGYISLGEGGEQVYVAEYRKRVEARILALAENHPTLEAIRRGESVSADQLAALERTLRQELETPSDIRLSTANIQKAYGVKTDSFLGFLRFVLALDGIPDYSEVVREEFNGHISRHAYSADQVRFLRAVQEIFTKKRSLALADLYEEPALEHFGRNAADRLFSQNELKEIVAMADRLAA